MRIDGTPALVTGGARRIGRAIALDLAENGFRVVVHHKDSAEEADAVVKEILDMGGTAATIRADLSAPGGPEAAMAEAGSVFGPIGLLVNNASIFEDDTAESFQAETWDPHFAMHALAPALLSREMAAALPSGLEGLVVNVIDQRVLKPTPRHFSYALSKATLWAATKTMAQSFGPKVRVNAIAPGPTLKGARQEEADFRAQVDGLILKRGPELSEFGLAIRFLWMARSVTGQMIALDGGQHLAWETPDAIQPE